MAMHGLVVEKFNGENFLSFADRFKSLMILDNALYENMLNGAESKDKEIDDDDFSDEEAIALSKRLKHLLLLHCEKNDRPSSTTTYDRSWCRAVATSTQAVQPKIQNDIDGPFGFYHVGHIRSV